jgi:hypothetical protein
MTDTLNADICPTMVFSSIFILSLFSRLFAKSHKGSKVSMSHHVIDIEVISTLPDEVLITQAKCSKHPDFIMDFFCNQHHVICCRSCMSEDPVEKKKHMLVGAILCQKVKLL